jgi:signal transduction histidine kinase/DNA-binding response OmpR family regulator/streptogramin lyase
LQALGPDSLLVLSGSELRLLVRSPNNWTVAPWRLPIAKPDSPFFLPRFARGPDRFWLAAGPRVWSFSRSLANVKEHPMKEVLGHDYADAQVNVIFFDHEGSMWWGTNRGAFLLRPALAFEEPLSILAPGLPNAVREVIIVGTTRWLTTAAGVFRVTDDGMVQLVSPNSVNALHYDKNGFVYSVADGQLVRFHAATGQQDLTFAPEGEEEGPRRSWHITEDRHGRIWIVRWNHLSCYDPVTNQLSDFHFRDPGSSADLGTIDLAVDKDDGLWVSTIMRGALRVENISTLRPGQKPEYREFRHDPDRPGSLSSDLVQQVHQTADGTIWVATDGGLNRYRPATQDFQRYLRGPGLSDDKFVSLTSGPASDLWLGSISHGIFHFDPVTETFTSYDINDGLAGNAMLLSSVFRQPDGGLWFGGQNGLQFFRPEVIKARTQVQSPSLSWLSYHRYRTDTTLHEHLPRSGRTEQSSLRITPEDNVVNWAFAALSFRSPETIDYYFRLEGFHNDWLPPTKNGELTLSQVPPGRYVLRARATDPTAGWSVEHPPIYLSVTPPWYWSNYAYALYGLLMLGLLYGLYQTLLLRRLSAERLGWFERIAHEFRTPLAIIAGAADRSQRGPEPERPAQLRLIEKQTHLLGGQVDRILELASLRATPVGPEKTIADFTAFHRYLLQSYASLAEEDNLNLAFNAPGGALHFAFAEEDWRAITGNLLSNALKFTPPGGLVAMALTSNPSHDGTFTVELTISDTGRGMSKTFMRRLFRPFYREDNGTTKGTGLGLALAKETADRAGAQLTATSEPGKGSTFTVRLSGISLDNSTSPSTDIAPVLRQGPAAPKTSLVADDDRPLIVIAEDHPELTAYLHYCLADGYRLLSASDGNTAWNLCQDRVPDLLLTDLLMPKLTGLELAERMAADSATDHIPVVMLTARSGDQARLAGLEAGAEAYLTKPFHRRELLTLVEGILDRRARLRARNQNADPAEKSTEAVTETILRAATTVVEARLADEDFSVADLAAAVFLSRTQLFRKLKALTGLTPTLFIRRIRLQQARLALQQLDQTVAEVAYAHGFRDPAYFARVFREEFGKSPSDARGFQSKG